MITVCDQSVILSAAVPDGGQPAPLRARARYARARERTVREQQASRFREQSANKITGTQRDG